MSSRFDHRSQDTFKKDIKFGTRMEQYWWNLWVDNSIDRTDLFITNPRDNGCGNDGEFIASGNTAGADFAADIAYEERTVKDHPIELKWVPTAGKFTLKENDLKAYIKEGASILFIYTSDNRGVDLRKPKDHDFDKHLVKIEQALGSVKWGLMWAYSVQDLYEHAKSNNLFKPVYYMGGKSALVLQAGDFDKWFTQKDWEGKDE